jgi:type IV secretory pathway VirB2 component (pilin)
MAVRQSTQNQEKSGTTRPADGADASPPPDPPVARKFTVWGVGAIVAAVLIVGVGIGLSAAVRSYRRAEARADARNRVTLTHIGIDRARQQAQITRAQIAATVADADKQFAQAVGIRRAQNEISRTLTGNYLQYEAIQAQKAVATSGRNNTLIYVPSGPNGVPLTQDPQNVNPLRPVPAR